MRWILIQLQALLLAFCLGQPSKASADPIADFYRGKTITFITVYSPGGSYDLYGRLIAANLPRFIPGNPRIVVQYLPGAGGLTGALRLANQSPKDGTEIGMPDRGIAVSQVLNSAGTPLDAGKFNWIGSVSSYDGIIQVSTRTGVKTADDLRRIPVVWGSWGVETSSYSFPMLLNTLAGMKFKVVTGYRGASDVDLAIEGGEVDARLSSWVTLKYLKPALLKDGKVVVVMQSGSKRNPDLPNIPLVREMASGEQGRRILEFIDSDASIGWSVVAPPGVPAERVAALRTAFDQMVKDPAFLADAQKRHLDIVPSSGQELEAIIKRTLAIPKDDVATMNKLLAVKK
jgi:tripartite-type tricarboxylate transporter receptor subunit TctC